MSNFRSVVMPGDTAQGLMAEMRALAGVTPQWGLHESSDKGPLKMGPGVEEPKVTAALRAMKKLRKKSDGTLNAATISAAAYAKEFKEPMYVYLGNSYMHTIWRVSNKPSEYLNRINNTGDKIGEVTPDLVFSWRKTPRGALGF